MTEAQRLSRTGSFSWKIATEEQGWSEEIFRIYEYDTATMPTLDLVRRRSHPDDASMLEQAFEQASSGAQIIDITHRLLMPDGSVKHVKVLAHPAQDKEDNVEYIGVLMDITAAKQAEEALQELQASLAHVTRVTALGELTASIAHEVNQPLAAIVTYGDAGLRWLNREVPQLDEVRSAVERMIDCAKLAGEVIARLRALSRKTTPEMVRLDINEVVNEVLSLIRREIANHQVSVRLDLAAPTYSTSLPPILGDRVQLQQVILNLLVNGIQAMAVVRDRPRELLIRTQADNTGQIWLRSGIAVLASTRRTPVSCSMPFSQRRRMAWAWACRSAVRLSRPMAAGYGHHPMPALGQFFSLRCPRIALMRCNWRELPGAQRREPISLR